ncbi:MAG: hypothetical protein IJ967_03140, partial [Phascolarctobacterium sp.]|nr:hypothetical protein [Phascolarctobacterium sp.]
GEKTPAQKKELTDAEKEYKSKRKQIQEKLIKFATRVPVFMYLTDYREFSLHDVITQLEPELFKKVTGLSIKDFELLVSLNVFNEALMNDAVYKFKRYEDASLEYTGINRHAGENVGLYSTVLRREDYEYMSNQQRKSMGEPIEEIEEILPVESKLKTIKYNFDIAKTSMLKVADSVAKYNLCVGCKVVHKKFGEGIVKDVNEDIIEITFGEQTKKLSYQAIKSSNLLEVKN